LLPPYTVATDFSSHRTTVLIICVYQSNSLVFSIRPQSMPIATTSFKPQIPIPLGKRLPHIRHQPQILAGPLCKHVPPGPPPASDTTLLRSWLYHTFPPASDTSGLPIPGLVHQYLPRGWIAASSNLMHVIPWTEEGAGWCRW